MNIEQTKTLTEIAYRAFHKACELERGFDDYEHAQFEKVDPETVKGFEAAASAVISHVLQGARWTLLEIGEEIRVGDEFYDYNRNPDFRWVKSPLGVIGEKIDYRHFIHRRPLSIPSSVRPKIPFVDGIVSLFEGKSGEPSTTPPASSGAAGDDVPAESEDVHKVLMENNHDLTRQVAKLHQSLDEAQEVNRGLQAERDQLRKELEGVKGDVRIAESHYEAADAECNRLTTENAALKEKNGDLKRHLETWQHTSERNRDEACRERARANDAESRLRSQFRWTPISERLPTEKDDNNIIWKEDRHAKFVVWYGGRTGNHLDGNDATHWMFYPPSVPSPETEEQAMRREFEAFVNSYQPPKPAELWDTKSAHDMAWAAYQAAKSTGGAA